MNYGFAATFSGWTEALRRAYACGEMPLYWYLLATCKTPGCKERQALKYFGPVDRSPDGFDVVMPEPLSIRCGTCRAVNHYSLEDTKVVQLPHLPPVGFEDKF